MTRTCSLTSLLLESIIEYIIKIWSDVFFELGQFFFFFEVCASFNIICWIYLQLDVLMREIWDGKMIFFRIFHTESLEGWCNFKKSFFIFRIWGDSRSSPKTVSRLIQNFRGSANGRDGEVGKVILYSNLFQWK